MRVAETRHGPPDASSSRHELGNCLGRSDEGVGRASSRDAATRAGVAMPILSMVVVPFTCAAL